MLKPISKSERIASIDIIRGFALLGILLVNLPTFYSANFIYQEYSIEKVYTGFDYWIDFVLQLFVQTKFYPIFSFLFGLGFYIFMSRAEQKGLNGRGLMVRRMFVLLVFGLLHLVFLWYGDILHVYAITGFVLLLVFYKRKTKTLLIWAFSLLFLFHAFTSIIFLVPESIYVEMNEELTQGYESQLNEYVDVYKYAPYSEWVSYRFENEVMLMVTNLPFVMVSVLPMFLLGLYAGRRGIFQNVAENSRFLKKVRRITFLLSLPTLTYLALIKLNVVQLGVFKLIGEALFVSLSGVTLSLFYISALTLLLEKEQWKNRLSWLGDVGRMALTNYLAQTVISLTIIMGFNLYGKLSLTVGTALALVIFAMQVFLSKWWLSKYRFGPMEWLWRTLTYGKRQPFKVSDVEHAE